MKEVEKRNKKERKCFFLLEFAYICRVGRNADIHWNRVGYWIGISCLFYRRSDNKIKKTAKSVSSFPF